MKKKVWEKPRLIVLFRGKQEENVLNGCKTNLQAGPNFTINCLQTGVIECSQSGS
ncbi:MAG: hypothetical protein JRG69_12555 [Deltaproteobacteria bacterium]|nr:hypothetical protein [Deltaproteobacteria bacterium]